MINPENIESPLESSVEGALVDEESSQKEIKAVKEKKPRQPIIDSQILEIEKLGSPQEKLQKAIDLMEISLAQTGTPNFKLFWEARKIGLEFFKDQNLANLKAVLWPKCNELTKEALRLKAVLEEQSAYAIEQIEGAIGALENEIQNISALLIKVADVDFPKSCTSISANRNTYINLQKELTLLNAYSSRITGLRKELMKTEMRIRQKNQFFQRLSAAGDKVFPRRKELIKIVSDLFIKDVESFEKSRYAENQVQGSLHDCREEIKSLQQIAKLLNLNTHAFNYTRTKLSDSWDKLKVAEQELKVVRNQKKESHLKNAELVVEKISAYSEHVQKGELSFSELQNEYQEVVQFMRSVELGRYEIKTLKDQLTDAHKPVLDNLKSEEKKRKEAAQEKVRQREEQVAGIQSQMDNLESETETLTSASLKDRLTTILEEVDTYSLSTDERRQFDLKHELLNDILAEKEEEELLNSEGEDLLEQLEEKLEEVLERRSEIKQNIEKYRKMSGGSGLDFQQSLHYNECINVEKERLDKINHRIDLLEDAISDRNE